jgi:hypothetical protein
MKQYTCSKALNGRKCTTTAHRKASTINDAILFYTRVAMVGKIVKGNK